MICAQLKIHIFLPNKDPLFISDPHDMFAQVIYWLIFMSAMSNNL